ncbi:LysM peptidoglycan-binding domain-containing protein [Aneurinibacillus sp. REN35]|uniref:LysM peptidoglycan-binding domain-containing protein n=1 Tax=Aneurinibacillus sp. REN35 TaxID=3237286 RepID=UPI003526DE37
MSEKQRNHADQADTLRKIVEERMEDDERSEIDTNHASEETKTERMQETASVSTGILPPRSTVHKKPPPLNLTPYYIAGALVLLVLSGLGFWWGAARNEPATALPQPKVEEANKKETGETPDKTPPAPSKAASPKTDNTKSNPQAPTGAQPSVPKTQAQVQNQTTPKPPAPIAPQAKPAAAKPTGVEKSSAAPSKNKKRVLRHRVQKGDTLYKISMMYYGTGKYQFYLARYNGIRQLNAGSVLKVPIPPR